MAKSPWNRVLWQRLAAFHAWCNRFEVPLLLLAWLFLLRLPNLAEPYWYGDEAIYLAIGTGLRRGLLLYRDIVDHKTPMIYWLAMAPSQAWFRILLIGWMSAATVLFWDAIRRLTNGRTAAVAGLLLATFTSLPSLEGNIPNGELFVIGFVAAALWLLARSMDWKGKKRWPWLIGSGLLAGLGILTKVPAILDAGALASLFWFSSLTEPKFSPRRWRPMVLFGLGVALTLLSSVLYFAARGTLNDYLQFGLLYNLHYSQNWGLPFRHPLLIWAFSLGGKIIILAAIFLLLSIQSWYKKVSPLLAWSIFWVAATFFAALLSNRPYPHYLLQVVPPAALTIALFLDAKMPRAKKVAALFPWLLTCLLIGGALLLLGFRPYPLAKYYLRTWSYLTGKIDREQFEQQFNPLVTQNRQLANVILRNSGETDRIFVWGTNPMLYALTRRAPATRFTVAFHIHDLKAYDQTINEVRQVKPAFVVVMKEESALPGLNVYLEGNYFLVESTRDMILYRRSNVNNHLLLQ